jgi:hypothetical protein
LQVQEPAEQEALAPQLRPHMPQCISVSSDCSQPFASFESQSPKPDSHEYSQLPAWQLIEVLGRAMHARSHMPQCAISVVRSTQLIPQRVVPWEQETTHA